MSADESPEGHRSGFVAVVGRPNVGKSALMNCLLGQSVAPVSPRPQTTRRRQLGILTLAQAQIIFVDTPGLHQPLHKLGQRMNALAQEAIRDSDLLLGVFDVSRRPTAEDEKLAREIQSLQGNTPVLLALNKVDLIRPDLLPSRLEFFHALLPEAEAMAISALRGDRRQELLDRILERLPVGPRYYPQDEITESFERDIAADLIRAAALRLLKDEVPHSIFVKTEEYKERGEQGAYIAATIFVERETQKPIVIGQKGRMLRDIGTMARREIESMSGRKVYLDLHVKVEPGWRNDEAALRRFGFRAGKPQ